jgi:hypothetical protein
MPSKVTPSFLLHPLLVFVPKVMKFLLNNGMKYWYFHTEIQD